jgi:hypothetical protein
MKNENTTGQKRICCPQIVEPGAVFGKWTVIGKNPHSRHGKVLCRCACGREKKVFVSNLLSGLSTSCCCPPKVVPGMMQGKLFVVGHPWIDSKGRKRVKCYCECGRTYFPRTDDLVHAYIQSCRCFLFQPEYRLSMREKAVAGLPYAALKDPSSLRPSRA